MGLRKITVQNLSRDARRSDLKDLFSKCGHIVDCYKTGRTAEVEFESQRAARKCVDEFDNYKLMGRRLLVDYYESRSRSVSQRSYQPRRRRNNFRDNRGGRYQNNRYDRNDRYNNNRYDRGGDRFQRRGPKDTDQCFVCREYGHWSSNCPKGTGEGVRSGKCFKCGERGHIAKRCPNQSDRDSGQRRRNKKRRRNSSGQRSRQRDNDKKSSKSGSNSRSRSNSSAKSKRSVQKSKDSKKSVDSRKSQRGGSKKSSRGGQKKSQRNSSRKSSVKSKSVRSKSGSASPPKKDDQLIQSYGQNDQ